MKFVSLTVIFLHYILAPLANAAIEKHVQDHHKFNKHEHVHQHGAHHHHHVESNHNDEKPTKDHVHTLIELDWTYLVNSNALPKVETKGMFLISFISPKPNELKIQQTKYYRKITFYPPPDQFRSLPLII